MKQKADLIFFCCMIVALIFLWHKKEDGTTVYFYPGYFGILPFNKNPCLYGINLDDLCKKQGYKFKVTSNLRNLKRVHKIIAFDVPWYYLGFLEKYPKKKLSLFLWEPPVVLPENYDLKNHSSFSKVFTWYDSIVDNKKYFKFFYPELNCIIEEGAIPFSEKKLCCLISRNLHSAHPAELYTSRIDAITFFENNASEQFDLFGFGWENAGFKSYKGSVPDKGILKNYKFSICYENTKDFSGYVTEKIFDSLKHLCVPIYLGADNITDYVPANCFIDRRNFNSNEELLSFIENMTEEEYLKYQQNIREFYKTPGAQRFSTDNFKKIFLQALK